MDLQAQSPRTGGSSSLSVPCWTHLPSRNRDLYTHSLKLLDVESQSRFSLHSGGWPVQSSKLCPWKAPPVSAVWPRAVSGPGRAAVQDYPPALLRMQLAKWSGTHTQAFPLPLPDLGGLPRRQGPRPECTVGGWRGEGSLLPWLSWALCSTQSQTQLSVS